jgi:hypothetical protein
MGRRCLELCQVFFAAGQVCTATDPDENVCSMFQIDDWNLVHSPQRNRVVRHGTGNSVCADAMALLGFTADAQSSSVTYMLLKL